MQSQKFVTVYTHINESYIELVKTILESEGIECFIKGVDNMKATISGETEREDYIKRSDLVYEGTIDKIVNIGNGDRFKAQAQEIHPDHNWLVVFKIAKILKGSYQYDELGMTVHSPTNSFGTYLFPFPHKKYRIYLRSQPSNFTDYIVVGDEWIK